MNAPVWTPSQARAIAAVGKSVAVSAAAGSGKTAVLAERCAYLMGDAPAPYRCRADQLLVVTFTELAAAEMRARIRASLMAKAQARPADRSLREQVLLLDTALIGTIHSFCLWLLRRWVGRSGLDPTASVLRPEQAALMQADALTEIVAEEYEAGGDEGESFRSLVEVYGLGADRPVRDFVLRLTRFLESLPEPDDWLDRALARLEWEGRQVLREQAAALLSELDAQSDAVRSLRTAVGPSDDAAGLRFLEEFAARVEQWRAELKAALATWPHGTPSLPERVERVRQDMVGFSFPVLRSPRKGREDLPPEQDSTAFLRAACGEVRDAFKSRILGRLAIYGPEDVHRELDFIHPYASTLVRLVRRLRLRFASSKRSASVMDFADMERTAYELVKDEQIVATLRAEFAHVLVDEYQDINPLQEAILRRVSRDEDAGQPPNLFTVGDVKQSIYRFRAAEPRMFIRRTAWCETSPQRAERITLRENFRSDRCVLEGVNHLFGRLMNAQAGGMTYGPDDSLAAGLPPRDGAFPYVDVHVLDRRVSPAFDPDEPADDAGEPDPGGADDPAEWDAIEREAYVIAEQIDEIVSSDHGPPRVAYSDIAVLLRAPAFRADRLAGFLKRRGIEASSAASGSLRETTEIRDVVALLEVLDNAHQDIPLAAVLRSPLLGAPLDEDALATIRGVRKSIPFHVAVQIYAREGGDAQLRATVEGLLRRLARARRDLQERSLADGVWSLLHQTGYWTYVGGLREGRQRRANLLRFYRVVRAFGESKPQGLHGFLRFLESLEREGRPLEAGGASGAAAAVRIMSIHAAKGLEFPVVFVADLGRSFNFLDARGRMIFERETGLGLHRIDTEKRLEYPSLAHRLTVAASEREVLAEELRILYVAMTRAKHRLILVGTVDSQRTQESPAAAAPAAWVLQRARSPLEWILPVIAVESAAPSVFRRFQHTAADMAKWRVDERDQDESATWRSAAARLAPLPPTEPLSGEGTAAAEVYERVTFDYPHQAVSSIPAVVSASQVKGAWDPWADAEQRAWTTRRLDVNGSKGDARRSSEEGLIRGVATHFLLQHLDFTAARSGEDVRRSVERLVSTGGIGIDEAASIDIEGVAWFLTTELAERIRRAGVGYRREFLFTASRPASYFDSAIPPTADESVLVRGRVDGILALDGTVEILDFKSEEMAASEVPARAERHRPQLALYATAVESIYRTPVSRGWLVFLAPRAIHEISFAT